MLENLEKLIRDNAQELVINNPDIPNEQNEQVIQAASGSIVDALKNQIGGGNITDLIGSLGQGNAGAVVNEVSDSFAGKLGALGINMDTAKSIGAALIPMIMAKFFNKAADPKDSSFDLQDILGKLAGGADGKFDLNDITDMLGGGKGKDGAGGGLLDKLKGLF